MLRVLRSRWRQGHQTHAFPAREPVLPERFRGCPRIDASACTSVVGDVRSDTEDSDQEILARGCQACAALCPTEAITLTASGPEIDLGRCLFCTECLQACPTGAISYSQDYRLAVRQRQDLYLRDQPLPLAEPLDQPLLKLLGRALRLRQVSAGGCNGCEADVNVLNTVGFDLSRFGIQFVASPRHADGLLVTGPITQNMRQALLDTYTAVPDPKIVIAVGACAISGGPFAGFPAVHDGVDGTLPVDLYIPGCPPHPFTILDGLLRLLQKRRPQGLLK